MMKRKSFVQEEKEFFRKNFPRLNTGGVRVLFENRNNLIQYAESLETIGNSMRFSDGSMWINIRQGLRTDRRDVTVLHEVLHCHYEDEDGLGRNLFNYISEKYGRMSSHYWLFPESGRVYGQKWESFLDEEAELLYKENPEILNEIRKHFREENYKKSWHKWYVREINGFTEKSPFPFEGAKVELVYY